MTRSPTFSVPASRGRLVRCGLALTAVLAVVPLITAAAVPQSGRPEPRGPAAQRQVPVPVRAVPVRRLSPRPGPAWHQPPVRWPSPGAAYVLVPRTGSRPAAAVRSEPNVALAVPGTGAVEAGRSPVWLSSLAPRPGGDAARSRVRVTVASRALARAAGVTGVIFSLTGTSAVASRLHVSLDYSSFAEAYGGDYASRLRLAELPGCVLTTPGAAACRVQRPLPTGNDVRALELGADVTLPGTRAGSGPGSAVRAGSSAAAPGLVLAASTSPSGSGGSYTATPLSEAGSWTVGGPAGAFTYSYPIAAPPVPGGLAPQVSLNYNSQAVDGLTSATNNQASWIGDGWDYSPGYIERDYETCSQDDLSPTIASADKTGDLCWSANNTTTLSLDGVNTTLVDDPSTGWHAEADNGEKISYLTGTSNGTYDGGYWVVTDPDGTSYYFGVALPGYKSGDTNADAAWTVPVYCPRSTDPSGCYNSTFSKSKAPMAWSWRLDYVTDPHGDAIVDLYNTETNYYAPDGGSTATAGYVQAGALSKIIYGLRASANVYGSATTPSGAAEVDFTTAQGRTDVPSDLACSSGQSCSVNSPSFWGKFQLTGIATKALDGSSMKAADSWALTQDYQATGETGTQPPLWLESVARTGEDGTSVKLPPVSFSNRPLPNRAVNPSNNTDGYAIIDRNRVDEVTNETGGVLTVSYLDPGGGCTSGALPAPDANTLSCYPVYWAGQSGAPSWFNKYVVSEVAQEDSTGDGPTVVTSYAYSGAAWHYDDDALSRSSTRTWDEFRGFAAVTTKTGTAPDPVTETTDTYFQGMNGDELAGGGTSSASLSATVGGVTVTVTDKDQWAGMPFEHVAFDGAGGAIVTATVTTPWSSAATATYTWPATDTLPALQAFITRTAKTQTFTALASGGFRESDVSYARDTYGRVTSEADAPDAADNGVAGDASEDTCTVTSYATSTSAWILDLPAEVTVTAEQPSDCPASGSVPAADFVSGKLTFYDGATSLSGDVPTKGDVTQTQEATSYNGSTPAYTVESASSYDEYGRVTSATDADGHVTTTAYTPATGAEPTSVQVTDPMKLVTTTTYDPLRDLPLTVTDPAGYVTATQYDALGRAVADWKPGNSGSGPANYTFSYSVSATAPSVITTKTEEPGGTYLTSETLYDALGRVRETQAQTADGNRDITDTLYNSDGWPVLTSSPYFTTGTPSGTLVSAPGDEVPSQTGYVYDGDGRVIRQISYRLSVETWETDTAYGGDYTTVTPPAGGTPETIYTDGRGLTTDIYQYHASPPPSTPPAAGSGSVAGKWDQASYAYTPAQQLATITDAAASTWSYRYDLAGQQVSQSDPDSGTATSTYDNNGNLLSVTDADGSTVSYQYDADGRKIAEYDGPVSGQSGSDELASWTYDTIRPGLLTKSVSYVGGTSGTAYTEQVLGYNAYRLPTGSETTIPSGGLAGTYVSEDSYADTGQLTSYVDGAAGGLPTETTGYGYDGAGQPTSVTGTWAYVDSLSYTELGQPLEYQFGSSAEPAWMLDSYDEQTGRLTESQVEAGTTPVTVDDQHYGYDDVGDITAEADTPSGGPAQVQCFQYDYLGRLVQAWAQGAAGCAATPSQSAEGGAAPYWNAYAYDVQDNLTQEVATPQTGSATTYASTFPATTGADGPHAVASQSAGAATTTFGYDADGNTTSISGPSGTQTLNWQGAGQVPGRLASVSSGSATTSYVYDASGNLLLQTDQGSATLYLPDEQITDTGGVLSGVRYYSIGGVTVAARTSAGQVEYLTGNQQGTASLAIDSATLAVTRRYYDPDGKPIGSLPASWPGTRGFVGGTADPATGLTDLGAREYDPATASFISTDPILTPYDPQDLNPYAYAADNPATSADPTGLHLSCGPDPCPNPGPAPGGGSGGSGESGGAPAGSGSSGGTGNVPGSSPGSTLLPEQDRAAYIEFDATFTDVNPYATGATLELDSIAIFCGENPSSCPSRLYQKSILDRLTLAAVTVGIVAVGMPGDEGENDLGASPDMAAREVPAAQEELGQLAAEDNLGGMDPRSLRASVGEPENPGPEWAQQDADRIHETMEHDENLVDAGQSLAQTLEALRGTPPSDWITSSPVQGSSSSPEITPTGQPGFGLEQAMVAGAVLARSIGILIARLSG